MIDPDTCDCHVLPHGEIIYCSTHSAAPELLEALKNLERRFSTGANSGEWGSWDAEDVEEIIAARAAITKATKP